MNIEAVLTVLVFGPIIIYAVVRIGSAAFFKSKQQFDHSEGSKNGP